MIAHALGASLGRALRRHGADADAVRAVIGDWRVLDHAKLARLGGPATHGAGIDLALRYPAQRASLSGRRPWDEALVVRDVVAEVNLLPFSPCDRPRQPRGGDPEVGRRLGEREGELGHHA